MSRSVIFIAVSMIFGSSCGIPENNVRIEVNQANVKSQPIINGEECDADTYPTAVAVLVDATIEASGFGTIPIHTVICTGTLIAPDVVLTASHCLDSSGLTFGFGEVTEEQYYVSFEPDLINLAEQENAAFPEDTIEAAGWIAHPDFSLESEGGALGLGDSSDIGLIFLSEIPEVQPEIVITEEEAVQITTNAEVFIAGWGQQTKTDGRFEQPPPNTVGRKICATSFINEVGDHEFQVGGNESTSRKCHGDSGGPTYITVETSHTEKQRVIGITSHAYDESDCAKGGVDIRIDGYLDWIEEQMVAACQDNIRIWCDVEGILPPDYFDPAPDPADYFTPPPLPEPEPEADGPVDGFDSLPLGCACVTLPPPPAHLGGILLLLLGASRAKRRKGY